MPVLVLEEGTIADLKAIKARPLVAEDNISHEAVLHGEDRRSQRGASATGGGASGMGAGSWNCLSLRGSTVCDLGGVGAAGRVRPG